MLETLFYKLTRLRTVFLACLIRLSDVVTKGLGLFVILCSVDLLVDQTWSLQQTKLHPELNRDFLCFNCY